MAESTEPKGPARIYVDLDRELSDSINAHCHANGLTKKGFFYKLAKDFIESQKTGKTSKKGKR